MPVIVGSVRGGVFSNVRHLMSTIKQFDDKQIEILIRKKKTKRTLQQNKYLWIIYKAVADMTGHTELEVHEGFKRKFLSYRTDDGFWLTRSTTTLNADEMADYISQIASFCSIELSFDIPNADEYGE